MLSERGHCARKLIRGTPWQPRNTYSSFTSTVDAFGFERVVATLVALSRV